MAGGRQVKKTDLLPSVDLRSTLKGMCVEVDAVVVGAGVVGIACALSLARQGQEVILLEAESHFGTQTSSRNSEVIHAGIYYPPNSLKARLCIEGRERLYAYCRSRGVSYKRIGKLIFASRPDELAMLDEIADRAALCGVKDIVRLSPEGIREMEPELSSLGALYSPSTGIVDSHGLMTAMIGELEALSGRLVCRTRVNRLARMHDGWAVHIDDLVEPALFARTVVNAAGLAAQKLAHVTEGLSAADIPPLFFARGSYFSYQGKVPFRHLIYPLPVPGGLGTHLTLDLAGRARFGPDVEWIDDISYETSRARFPAFLDAAKSLWPALDPTLLAPDFAGIRPKLAREGFSDFRLSGPDDHGLPGLVNLFGIESPGLTAALAIGEEILSIFLESTRGSGKKSS